MPGETPVRRETARLFLALWPSPRLRKALLDHQEAWRWNPRASLVRSEKLHLTLHFIGNVPHDRVALLVKALEVPFSPFTLDFGPPALWHSGVAVLQPKAAPTDLKRLHDALGQALQQLELPVESREFRPHITLARRASGSLAPTDKPALHWPVRSYVLVESRPEPASRYRLLKRYKRYA